MWYYTVSLFIFFSKIHVIQMLWGVYLGKCRTCFVKCLLVHYLRVFYFNIIIKYVKYHMYFCTKSFEIVMNQEKIKHFSREFDKHDLSTLLFLLIYRVYLGLWKSVSDFDGKLESLTNWAWPSKYVEYSINFWYKHFEIVLNPA